MDAPRDAGIGAATFSLELNRLVHQTFADAVATIGRMEFHLGSLNVVPKRVDVSVETRAPSEDQLEELESEMIGQAELCGERHQLTISVEKLGGIPASPLDSHMRSLILQSARTLNLRTLEMLSGAGHDAQVLAGFTPPGLIFVLSISGISHNPKENTTSPDCIHGANVLLGTALRCITDI